MYGPIMATTYEGNDMDDGLARIIGALPAPAWSAQGVCATHEDPDMWFPDKDEPARRDEALKLCSTCPVVRECRQHAIDTRQRSGIWGGTTAGARRREWSEKAAA